MTQYLGLKRKTQLKRAIFLSLDEQASFSDWSQLRQQLKIEQDLLQQLAFELQTELKNYYLLNEVELIIDARQGLFLKKEHGESPLNIAAAGNDDFFIQIIQEVFSREDWTLDELCDAFFISKSTAKRKLRLLNQQLASFEVKITSSTYVRLVGAERHIRSFYTLFAYLSFQKTAFYPYLTEKDHTAYHEKVQKVRQVFKQQISCLHKDFFALFFTLHDLRIRRDKHVLTILADAPKSLLVIFPEKPSELSYWNEEDWAFFVICLFLFNIFTPNETELMFLQQNIFIAERNAWQNCFQKPFNLHDETNFDPIQIHLIRILLFTNLFPKNNYLFHLFPFVNYLSFEQNQPLYNQCFKCFWDLFIAQFPEYATTYFKMQSFLLMRYLIPRNQNPNQIKIYLASELTIFYQSNFQLAIQEYFCHTYEFDWVEDENDAELIVYTFPFFENAFNKPALYLSPFMKEKDYDLLDARLEQFVVERAEV
ncbi:MAG: hypothetical protein GX180_11090 [Enterococcus sp.]|nr:hypothetical protein [Enterococcus sp.]